MCFEVAGTLLGIGVYTVFYTILVQSKDEDCSDGQRQPDKAMRATFRYHALTLGILTFFFILTTFIGVREQQGQLISRFILLEPCIKGGVIPTKGTRLSNWYKYFCIFIMIHCLVYPTQRKSIQIRRSVSSKASKRQYHLNLTSFSCCWSYFPGFPFK